MLQYITGHDAAVANFVAAMIPHVGELGFGNARAIGVADASGRLLGGMVYHNWDPYSGTIEMSGAAIDPRWLTRKTLMLLYSFAFLEIRAQMVLMRVPMENERVLRQLAAYGYEFIKLPRMFGRERDGVVCMLTDDEWLHNKFNKKLTAELKQRKAA